MSGPLVARASADLTPQNLALVLTDMGVEPGWHASADLYGWYASMAQEDDLEPVSKKMFGLTLGKMGYRSSIRRVGGKHARCWFLTRRAFRGGDDTDVSRGRSGSDVRRDRRMGP